ncbi:hypothetical protein [Photorhabdus sp. RM96S]|uniref:hypothetical protein n=1 Tax=Photorhabdus sp. RM96S TaxID=3342822 RepID=UPI0036DCD0ED
MTGVSECSQQRGNLKDNGYIFFGAFLLILAMAILIRGSDRVAAITANKCRAGVAPH